VSIFHNFSTDLLNIQKEIYQQEKGNTKGVEKIKNLELCEKEEIKKMVGH